MRAQSMFALFVSLSMLLSVLSLVPLPGSALPAAALMPPAIEYTQDTDADGLYDYLVFDVAFEAYVSDDYFLFLKLKDSLGEHIYGTGIGAFVTPGVYVYTLSMEGIMISAHGIDGPYTAEVILSVEDGLVIDSFNHTTAAYSCDEFEPMPAVFHSYVSVSARDVDGNGRFEFLDVQCNIEVFEENNYTLMCSIVAWTGLSWIHIVSGQRWTFHLGVGIQLVSLPVRGSYINAAEQDGPYYLSLSLHDPKEDYLRNLDDTSYVTGDFDYEDFEAGSFSSPLSSSTPVIDGEYGEGEWEDALVVDLARPDMENPFGGAMLVKNSQTHMFVCLDAVSDLTEDMGDCASISFDTGNDNAMTDGREDQFLIGSFMHQQSEHLVFSEDEADWVVHCAPLDPTLPGHEGLDAAVGFGTSPGSVDEHRVFEIAIPLGLIGAKPGGLIGFAATSSLLPGVFDESRDDGISWPYDMEVNSSLIHFGDVLVGWPPLITVVSLSGTIGLGGWYVSPVTVALSGTGGQLGYDSSTYRLDLGEWTDYVAPFTCDADGVHFLWYQSCDSVGNVDEIGFLELYLDSGKPVTAASVSGMNVTLTATDSVSGVSGTVYRIDGGAWADYTGQFEVSREEPHTVEYYSVDIAGNVEDTRSLEIEADDEGGGGILADMNFYMVLAIIAIIVLISIGAIFGMKKKAKDAESKHIIKDMASPLAQMQEDVPPPRTQEPPEPPEDK